ncbi:MAG: permease [Planctomycetes bacterium]|nr:permease [Planctomycetota bacterium]
MSYAMEHPIAIRAGESARAAFIRRTYGHLAGAVLAFVALEVAIFNLLPDEVLRGMLRMMVGTPWSWLIVLVAFMAVGWLANAWAQSDTSVGMQYLGLSLYVIAEAIIFVPLLYIAQYGLQNATHTETPVIRIAGILTLCLFGALTTIVFTTRKDFSFLGPILCIVSFLALGVILVMALIPGASMGNLGLWFSFAMVAMAGGYILYYTSNVLHHYRTDQHVAAALALFAAVALLFWYILQIVMSLSRDR